MNQQVTGKPSIDKPWMKYYPPQLIQGLTIPAQTVYEYLMERCPGDDVVAIHYYGRDIRWRELKEQVDLAARSLRAIRICRGRSDTDIFAGSSGIYLPATCCGENRSLCFVQRQ